MFHFVGSRARDAAVAQSDAISRSQAVIEFSLDGIIITANDNFLRTLGYSLEEILGRHHSMFVTPATQESIDYLEMWTALRAGQFQIGQYKRIGKGDCEIWIQASYNPVLDKQGRPYKVIKYALDVTAEKIRGMEADGKIAALDRAQAVIEFAMDGTM